MLVNSNQQVLSTETRTSPAQAKVSVPVGKVRIFQGLRECTVVTVGAFSNCATRAEVSGERYGR